MNELLELIEEAKKSSGCRTEKEGELYRVFAEELINIQWFIGFIETEGHRVWVQEWPEIIEDTTIYGALVEIVHKDDVAEEDRNGYTVICDYDRD